MGKLQLLFAISRSLSVRRSQRVSKIRDAKTLADEKCEGTKVYGSSLRVRHGDVASMNRSTDFKYGKRLHIPPIGDFIEVAGNIFNAYLKSFFREAYPPVCLGDGMRCGNFKVIKTDLPDHCVLAFDDVGGICKQMVQIRELVEVGFGDVGGICKQMAQIRELVELPFIHPRIFQSIGIKPHKEVLLHGPPGSGKPQIIGAVANETVAFFLCINGPEVLSKMAGESERKLRKGFDEAENIAPSIISIDKIYSIGSKINKANGEVVGRIVSQLRALIDGLKSCARAIVKDTPHCPYSIDPAFARIGRFDRVDLEEIFKETHAHVGSDFAPLCTEVALQGIREMDVFDLVDESIDAEILNSMAVLNVNFASSNPSVLRETVNVKRGEDAISVAYETCDLPKGDRSNLRVRLGDVVSVQQCANVNHKRVHAISIGDFIEGVAGNLFDAYLKRNFLDSYPPLRKADLFPFKEGKEIVEFKGQIRELGELRVGHLLHSQSISVKPPKGNLLYSGEALLARAVANEIVAFLSCIDWPVVMSKMPGESKSNLKNAFEEADKNAFEEAGKNAPSSIFIDQIDSISPKSERRIVSQLMPFMDGLKSRANVIVLGITNHPNNIYPGLDIFKRFDSEIDIGISEEVVRLELIRIHTKNMKLAEEVNLEAVFKEPFVYVGADLAALCTEAARQCIREKVNVIDFEDESIYVEILDSMAVLNEHIAASIRSASRETVRVVEVPNVSREDLGGLENVKRELHELTNLHNRPVSVYERRSKMKERSVFDRRSCGGPYGGGKVPMHFFCTDSGSTLQEYQSHDMVYTKQVLVKTRTKFYQNALTSHTPVYNHNYGSPVAFLFFDSLNMDHIFYCLKKCEGRNVVSVVEYSDNWLLIENHVFCTVREWLSSAYGKFLQHPSRTTWVDYISDDIFTIFRSIHLGIMELHDHKFVFLGSLDDIVLTTKSIDNFENGRLIVFSKPGDEVYEMDVHNSRNLLYYCLKYDKTVNGISWNEVPEESWTNKLKIFLKDMKSPSISILPPSFFLDHPFLYREAVNDMLYIRKVNLKICFFSGMSDDIIVSLLDQSALNDNYLKDWKRLLRNDLRTNKQIITCLDERYKGDYIRYCKKCDKLGVPKESEIDFRAHRDIERMFRDFVKIPYDLQRHCNRYIGPHQSPRQLEDISRIAENLLDGANVRIHSLLIQKFGDIVDIGLYSWDRRDIYQKDLRKEQAKFLNSNVPW